MTPRLPVRAVAGSTCSILLQLFDFDTAARHNSGCQAPLLCIDLLRQPRPGQLVRPFIALLLASGRVFQARPSFQRSPRLPSLRRPQQLSLASSLFRFSVPRQFLCFTSLVPFSESAYFAVSVFSVPAPHCTRLFLPTSLWAFFSVLLLCPTSLSYFSVPLPLRASFVPPLPLHLSLPIRLFRSLSRACVPLLWRSTSVGTLSVPKKRASSLPLNQQTVCREFSRARCRRRD